MKSFNEISSFIWEVCDDVLRGLFKQHEYGDIILPFLFILFHILIFYLCTLILSFIDVVVLLSLFL